MKKSPIALVPALDRGLDILEWMSLQTESVTLTQIGRGMGLSVSEIQRPVSCLQRRGFLNRSSADTYSLSGLLYHLVQSHPPFRRLELAALSAMKSFAREEKESIHLCVPDGDSALLLLDVPGEKFVRISLQVGTRMNAFETVSGRLLNAFNLLDTRVKPSRSLALRLSHIRSQGYEQSESSTVEGITDLGIPVMDRSGKALAALTISILHLHKTAIDPKKLVQSLRKCAEKITSAL